MISDLVRLLEYVKLVFSSIIGTMTGFYFKKFLFESSEPNTAILIVIIVLVIVASIVFNYLANYSINKSKFIRKLILGKNFIEGDWIQKVTDSFKGANQPTYTITNISFQKGEYIISGESFDEEGKLLANFYSRSSEFNKNELQYSFDSILTNHPENKIVGISELRFSYYKNKACRYIGTVFTNAREKPFRIEATKINEKELLDFNSKEERKAAISLLNS